MTLVDDLDRTLGSIESTISNDLYRVLDGAERLLLDARTSLQGFGGDANARQAEQLVIQALDALRQARYGSLVQYESQSAQLRTQLRD